MPVEPGAQAVAGRRPITAQTALYGVIGYPVGHSRSPAIHNAWFAALGLDARYLALPVAPDALPAALDGARALGIHGLNVTIPHKEAALAWALAIGADVSPAARAIGAVNTVGYGPHPLAPSPTGGGGDSRTGLPLGRADELYTRRDGDAGDSRDAVWVDNTDAPGLLAALADEGFAPAGRRVVVLGAGGAARAAAWALALEGASVVVCNRTRERAERLVAELRAAGAPGVLEVVSWAEAPAALREADLLVNGTSVGMAPHADAAPIDLASVAHTRLLVYDTIYAPAETLLMRSARLAGARTANGLGMLLHQAAEAFALWTGIRPPVEAARRALGARRDG